MDIITTGYAQCGKRCLTTYGFSRLLVDSCMTSGTSQSADNMGTSALDAQKKAADSFHVRATQSF